MPSGQHRAELQRLGPYALRLIARRGGFLARKGNGEPGARTIRLRLQDITVFVKGARYARQLDVATCV